MIVLGEGNYLMKTGVLKNSDHIDLKLYHNFNHKREGEELGEEDFNHYMGGIRMTGGFALSLGIHLIKCWYAKSKDKDKLVKVVKGVINEND